MTGRTHDVHRSQLRGRRPRSDDSLLCQGAEPALGAHLITRRAFYSHHGIYAGSSRVIHYSGLADGWHRGPVEDVSLERFAHGRAIRVRYEPPGFIGREVVERARSRLGEQRYRLLTNNCEHFCEWCVRGEPRSFQVDKLTACCSRTWRRLLKLLNPTLLLRRRSAPIGYSEAGYATTN